MQRRPWPLAAARHARPLPLAPPCGRRRWPGRPGGQRRPCAPPAAATAASSWPGSSPSCRRGAWLGGERPGWPAVPSDPPTLAACGRRAGSRLPAACHSCSCTPLLCVCCHPCAACRTQDMAGDPFGLLLRQRIVFFGGEVRLCARQGCRRCASTACRMQCRSPIGGAAGIRDCAAAQPQCSALLAPGMRPCVCATHHTGPPPPLPARLTRASLLCCAAPQVNDFSADAMISQLLLLDAQDPTKVRRRGAGLAAPQTMRTPPLGLLRTSLRSRPRCSSQPALVPTTPSPPLPLHPCPTPAPRRTSSCSSTRRAAA